MKKSLLAIMAIHFMAFQAKAGAGSGLYEKREEPTLKSVADAIDKIATAFDEYKKVNDQRIEALKSGQSTTDFDAKLAAIDKHLDTLGEAKSRLEKIEAKMSRPGAGVAGTEQRESKEELAYKAAFFSWVRHPEDNELRSRLQQRGRELAASDRRSQGDDDLETRATQTVVGTSGAGGYALPKVVEQQIARLSVDISPIRQLATVRTVGSTDYHELFDVNGAGFEWVGETDARNQTNTPDLVEIVPTFGMASAKPQASEESLDDLFFNVESWLVESAAESMAAGEGIAFVSGNGTKKPTGFLAGPAPVATADVGRAFGTLQYIASGQAAALPTSLDPYYDLVYALRARYRRNARWVTSKLVLSTLRKAREAAGSGQYLWQPSITAGQPDTFLGYPVTEAEDMPGVAANSFPLAFGDFKEGYLIADRVGMRMTRDEITTPGFVKFYVRKRVGGKLRNTQAIKVLKIATA